MLIPWYAISILSLQCLLRGFQIFWIHQHNTLPSGIWAQLPWLLWTDVCVAVLAGIVWDWGWPQLSRRLLPRRQKQLRLCFIAAYALLLAYLGFSFKFYSLFETFFNYSFWIQVDRLSAYWRNILAEVDFWMLACELILAACGTLTVYAARRFPATPVPKPKLRRTVYTLLLVFLVGFAPFGHHLPHQQNWFALDENFLLALRTFVLPEPAAATTPRTWEKTASPAQAKRTGILRDLPLAERQKLNVVILLLESMTPEYAGITRPGYRAHLPNLTRLAAESRVFPNHYCQEPATLKSLYSILTGRYSYSTRRWKDFIARAQSDPSLPEILRQHGYSTFFLTSANGRTYSQNDFLKGRFDEVRDRTVLKKQYPQWADFYDCMDDRVLIGAFDDTLRNVKDKTFFIMLAPYFPHHPYPIPGPEFKVTPGNTPFERYQNSIHFTDYLVGELLRVLDQHHLKENTLLVMLSDHGEAFQQHPGNYLHSIYLYEENVRTVCLFRNPRLIKPGTSLELTRHIDVTPAILNALGYPYTAADGVDFLEFQSPVTASFYTVFNDPRFGMRDRYWKYIFNQRYGTEELFNLETDPQEQHNLAETNSRQCLQYRNDLKILKEKIR